MKRSRFRNKSHAPHNLVLEEIIGLTTKNGNGLASSISSSKCAYIAGCVVVLYDVHSGTQSHLMSPNRVPKPLSCVALSRDASIVAAGETLVTVLSLQRFHSCNSSPKVAPSDFFPRICKHLVSAGFPRDGHICLWDWRHKILAAKVKASSYSSHIASITFSLDKKFIVAAGKSHLKFWKVGWSPGSRAISRSVSVTMQCKVNLGHHEESSFVAVASPNWMNSSSTNHSQAVEQIPFYAVTGKGTLCMVYSGSSVINSVELEVEKCFGLSTSTSLVACACNNGLVKLFGTNSLEYAGELSYVEAKRCRESNLVDCQTDTLPDAIACQFSTPEKLVVVYDDHSLHIWNIHDIHKATRCCVLVSHSGCIWDIKNVPCENMHDPSLSCVAKGCSGGLSFATCSTDGNIRLWDLALQSAMSENSLLLLGNDSSNGATCLASAGIFERDSVAKGVQSPGFRSMAVSSYGMHLAAGDCHGDIHIFNLCTSDYILVQEAHGAEILSLSFSVGDKSDCAPTETSGIRHFLASGGQDGKIHLFDVVRNFNLVGSINYHSCAVTIVKVARSGREILSCGADRSVVLHSVDVSDTECKISCLRRLATSGTIYDVVVDHAMDVAFTIGPDKKINAFDVQSGKLIRWFQHDGDVADPMKVTTDGSRSYLACSYSNGCISVYDYISGEMVAQANGHSDAVTGFVFLPDCKRLVSVGADGCIFVWKLPALASSRMLQRTKEVFQLPPQTVNQPLTFTQIKPDLVVDHQQNGSSKEASLYGNLSQTCGDMVFHGGRSGNNEGFRFSISRLPKWARYQVINSSVSADIDSSSSQVGLRQDYSCLESKSSSSDTLEVGHQVSETLSRCSSERDSSKVHTSPPESYSWASNNRWLTIHTVCMDLLDSPKTCDMKGLSAQGSATDSRCTAQGLLMGTTHSNKRIKLSSLDPSINNSTVQPNFQHSEHANLQDSPFEECKRDDASIIDSQENDICEMNFGNLSAEPKTDRGKSSTMSSYVSRFVVRRELLEGRKRSLCMHAQDSIGGSPRDTKRASSMFLQMQPSKSLLEYAGNAPPISQGQMSDMPEIDSTGARDGITSTELPLNMKDVNTGDLESLDVDKIREVETSRLCEEALDNLEAAAENTLQSFSKVATGNIGEEKPNGVEAQLYAKAATRLAAVERKLQAIAKLLQPAGN